MDMPLSAKSIAVLEDWKRRHARVSLPVELSMQEIAEVYAKQRSEDARAHALWAADRLVRVLRASDRDAYKELTIADQWAYGILRKRYLVRREVLQVAYEHALKLAVKGSKAIN